MMNEVLTSRSLRRVGGVPVGLALFFAGGCVNQLPPPAAPAREIPSEIAEEARRRRAVEGRGTIVLDVVDGVGSVEDLGTEADGARTTTVCASTPCVVDLAVGEHRLAFHHEGRDDEVTLTVGGAPRVLRHVMSYDSGEHQEYLALALGGLTIGGGLSPIFGTLASIDGNDLQPPDVGLILGGALAGAAIVTGIVGVVMMLVQPREVREGLSLQWDLVP